MTDHLFRDRIPDLAKNSLNGGITTIIDAAFLKYKERRIMFSISKTMKVPYIIIECKCSDSIAKTRIKDRLKKGLDPSDATLEIREKQKSYIEYLNAKEAKHVVVYDQKTPLKDLVQSINSLMKNKK